MATTGIEAHFAAPDQRLTVEEMLQKLLGAGYDVTFAASESKGCDCFVIAGSGDTIVGSGPTPAAALLEASASPEAEAAVHLAGMRPAPDCACGHWEAGHCDRKDGSRPCGYAGCGCAAYRPAAEPCGLCRLRAERGVEPPPGGCTCQAAPAVAFPPLPWILLEDKATWRAQLPDGRTAVIERLDDGESFLPKVHESRSDFAVGPVCAGVLEAAGWCTEYAGA